MNDVDTSPLTMADIERWHHRLEAARRRDPDDKLLMLVPPCLLPVWRKRLSGLRPNSQDMKQLRRRTIGRNQ